MTVENLIIVNISLVILTILLLILLLLRKNNKNQQTEGNKEQNDKINEINYLIKQLGNSLENKSQNIVYAINLANDKSHKNLNENNMRLATSFNDNVNQITKFIHNNNEKTLERNSNFERQLSGIFNENTRNISLTIQNDFKKLSETIERHLGLLNDKVEERLEKSFSETNKTFANIIERLTKIDEAQKKIDNLSTDIVSLQNVLTDKKARGTFGEVQLSHILSSVFGERAENIYKLQHKLPNNTIADAVVFIPEPIGTIAVDSKFPLENYQRMVDKEVSEFERKVAIKNFKSDIKKHIDDISTKYIIQNITTNQAIMFIPAEAIFAEINAYHQDIVEYSNKKKVWLVSPTTFMSTLTTIQVILRDLERNKHSKILHQELQKLSVEFERYSERWDKLSRNIKTVYNTTNELDTTADKINKKFSSIAKVDLEMLEDNTEKIEFE